ncbi:hypothetical protein ACFX16_026919 [Malus domestica]
MVLTTVADEMPDLLGDVWGGVRLTWSTPDCPDCETRGGDSGFNRDADRIMCSNILVLKYYMLEYLTEEFVESQCRRVCSLFPQISVIWKQP